MEERFDKILKIWNDSTGNIFYREDMINIEKIEVVNHILYVTLKNKTVKNYSLIDNGFNCSFTVS